MVRPLSFIPECHSESWSAESGPSLWSTEKSGLADREVVASVARKEDSIVDPIGNSGLLVRQP